MAILVQLPDFKKNNVTPALLELILMHARSRLMTNDDCTKIKAIRGHTLDRFGADKLHEKIQDEEHYVHHPMWRGLEDPPDHLVFELSNENYMDNWKRMGTFVPSISQKFHTMRVVKGTAKQNFGSSNVTICLFISTNTLLDLIPNIEMYIDPGGRIVTKCGLPWSAVTMIRENNDDGTIIDKDRVGLRPTPAAPRGPPRVRSRDSRGEVYPVNTPQLPLPDRKVTTKKGKELSTGFHNMLERMTYGSPWQQHQQLQMLKGVYKSVRCDYDFGGRRCIKGDDCCFAHRGDNNSVIEDRVKPFRREIFMKLYNERFSLPLQHLPGIGMISDADLIVGKQKREDFENRTGGRDHRPRHHDNSRSPRSSEHDNTTPPPPGERASGSGQGNPPALAGGHEIIEDRQRDHTSGDRDEDEDSANEEAASPIEANNDANNDYIKIETPLDLAEPEAMQMRQSKTAKK